MLEDGHYPNLLSTALLLSPRCVLRVATIFPIPYVTKMNHLCKDNLSMKNYLFCLSFFLAFAHFF